MERWPEPKPPTGPSPFRRFLVALAAILGLFVVVALVVEAVDGDDGGGMGGDGVEVSCSTATAATMKIVSEGLTTAGGGTLSQGRLGEVEGSAGTYLVADIDAEGMEGPDERAVWWLGRDLSSPADVGPIFAVDALAREFSDWGAAARPDSPADDAREARKPEARAVKEQCR